MRPAGAELPYDPLDLLHAARTGVNVGSPQLGEQEVPPAEHVERQITVAVVIAVEEAALLMPVQRIVGSVEIKDNLLRRPLVSFQEQRQQQCFDRSFVVGDLMIA